jgi:hypothetical protein
MIYTSRLQLLGNGINEDVNKLSWELNNGKLTSQFSDQREKANAIIGKRVFLFLVVSKAELAERMRLKIPSHLKDVTEVIYFPVVSRISELLQVQSVYHAASSIHAFSQPDHAQLLDVLKAYAWAWQEARIGSGNRNLNNVYTLAMSLDSAGKIFILKRQRPVFEGKLWEKFRQILDGIDGLKWSISRGYFEYEYLGTQGYKNDLPCGEPGFLKFMQSICDNLPSTLDEFEEILHA